ncbi:MAG: M48 family metalloprotease [Luteitalea sp.]|nr:M48 family metalloprotease [Luteitalea sp.]
MNEDKGTRYQRLKRRVGVLTLAWSVLFLAGVMASGVSNALRELAAGAAPSGPEAVHVPLVAAIYVVLLMGLHEACGLPLAFYGGYVLERRYGLSNEPLRVWLWDQVKSLAIRVPLAVVAAGVVYAFIGRSAGGWWLPSGAAFAVLVVGLANLGPVLLLPLFYSVKPLERESLRRRLITLAERAGARVLGAYEWGLAEKTKKANAALAGLGSTRRILVSDTMLAEYSEDEIEVVLAHELAHYVHNDIWKGLVLESALILGGFYVAARLLEWSVPVFELAGPADPAGLPILLLGAGAVSLVTLPVARALSRAYERSADMFALKLTNNPAAFVSAMRRLAVQNLAEDQPSKIVEWLFYSHPPIRERIGAAQAFNALKPRGDAEGRRFR